MVVVATDIGGTFTDIVALEASGRLTIGKVLSTPASYADGLLDGVAWPCPGRRLAARGDHPALARLYGRDQRGPREERCPDRSGDDGRFSRRPRTAPDSRTAALRALVPAARSAGSAQPALRGVGTNRRRRLGGRAAGPGGARGARRPDRGGKTRGGRRLPDQRARQPHARAKDRGSPGDGVSPDVLVPVGGCPARASRIRTHQHHGRERLCGAGGRAHTLPRSSPGSKRHR